MSGTVGERLQEAIDAWHGGVSAFQRDLAVRAEEHFEATSEVVQGTSIASVFRYLKPGGTSEPSATWLSIAADVLNVNFGWLAGGRGPRTHEEAAGFERSSALDIAFKFGAVSAHQSADQAVVTALRGVFGRLLASLPDGAFGVSTEQARDLAMMLEDAVFEPMHFVAPGRKGNRTRIKEDPERWRTYATLVILAMDVAMRPPGENVSADELLERWHLFKKFDEEAFELVKARRS